MLQVKIIYILVLLYIKIYLVQLTEKLKYLFVAKPHKS